MHDQNSEAEFFLELQKEGLHISEQINVASSQYQQDVEELKSQMNTMKHKLAALEQTRNSEVASMEDQLDRVRKRIQELEFDDSTKSSSIILNETQS